MKIFATIILSLMSIAYPLLWYWGRENGAFYWLAAGMAILWLARAGLQKTPQQRAISLLVAVFFVVILCLRLPQSMYWYPVWVNALMLAVFGGSLFSKQPLIERLARLQQPDLPESGVRYTRKVTQIWCGFFILNGSIAAALVWLKQYHLWAVYTGIVAYILMGLLMGGEWLYRKWVVKI